MSVGNGLRYINGVREFQWYLCSLLKEGEEIFSCLDKCEFMVSAATIKQLSCEIKKDDKQNMKYSECFSLPVTSEDSPEGGPLSLCAPIHPPISSRERWRTVEPK